MNLKIIIAFLFLVLAIPNLAPAQTAPAPAQRAVPERFVYEWTDDNGVVHVTDDQSQVPKRYLNKSLKKKAEPRREEVQEKPQRKAVGPAPESTESSDQDQELKQQWQQRYFEWKNKLERSEQRYHSLEQKRANLLTKWGSPAVAPPAVREEVGQVDKALQDAQAEIDEARHMIEVALPDEARKAGVPPGWLRE